MSKKGVKVLRGRKSEAHLRKVLKSWRNETAYMLIEIGFKPKEIDELFEGFIAAAAGMNEDPEAPNLDALDEVLSRIEPGTKFWKVFEEEITK